MKTLVVFPMKVFGSATLVFPELPWSITGMECASWDRECGHGGIHPMLRDTCEMLDKQEASDLVRDYVRLYQVKENIEIAYKWRKQFDERRKELAEWHKNLAENDV